MDTSGWRQNQPRKENLRFAFQLFFGGVNLLLLIWIAPKFEQIYQDTLPDFVLPPLTGIVIGYRFLIGLAVAGWMLFCGFTKWRQGLYTTLWINLGTIWTFLQLGVIVFALLHPLFIYHGGPGPGR